MKPMIERWAKIILDNTKEAVIRWSLTGEITLWNIAAEKLYGYAEIHALNKSARLIVPESNLAEFTSLRNEILQLRQPTTVSNVRRNKDGALIDVLIQLHPVSGPEGELVAGILEIGTPKISEEEDQPADSTADIRLSLSMAHDLRNALSALTNIAYLLEHRTETRHVEMMKKQILFCESIVNNFLQLHSGRVPKREPIEIAGVVEEIVNLMNLSTHLQVKVVQNNSPQAFADPGHFRQVLMNLIQNAMEATEEERGKIEIVIGEERNFARIDVSDNGPGIPEQLISSIFEPLVTTKQKGYGLGLSASKHLVEANRGFLQVETHEGSGSVFSIFLPKA
jgi:PAS domain S-box-containing protein